MKYLSKAQVAFVKSKSDVDMGFYTFYVHPDDQILFKAKLAQVLITKRRPMLQGNKSRPLVLTVTRHNPPKTRPQENMYRGIVRAICTQEQSEAYGSDPDNVHEGVLARACLSYGYPTIEVAGVRVPERSKMTDTVNMNLLMEVARVIAGEYGADVSHIGLED